VEVLGCPIAYTRSGVQGRPPAVLVHGGGAHAGWWLGVEPLLAATRDVVTVELSGHGDSGHRYSYGADVWASELQAVIDDLGRGPAVLVGHSLGGLISLHTAGTRPDHVCGVIAIDSAVIPSAPMPRRGNGVKFYASRDEAVANFRLRPRATTADAALLAAVADPPSSTASTASWPTAARWTSSAS